MEARVIGLEKLGKHDVELVGGKNSSLGEMISHLSNAGVSVPGGFATTADAYREFLDQSGLNARIQAELAELNVDDVNALAETGAKIRQWIVETPLTPGLEQEIREAFAALSNGNPDIAVAVRSSATAEDLPDASFAGQQETFLNIRGIDNVLIAVKEVFASLFNDRAIAYRVHQGFEHSLVALSAGVHLCAQPLLWLRPERPFNPGPCHHLAGRADERHPLHPEAGFPGDGQQHSDPDHLPRHPDGRAGNPGLAAEENQVPRP